MTTPRRFTITEPAFMVVPDEDRRLLQQQREDIEITLAETGQPATRCCNPLSAAAAPAAQTTASGRPDARQPR